MTNSQLIEIHLNNTDLTLINLAVISGRNSLEVLDILKDSHYIEILKKQ
jgi:hypothetical protein